jgi:hypothetical protein
VAIASPTNVPSPDPSSLTTEQLRHELGGLEKLIETRLDAMDRANVLLKTDVDRVPSAMDREIQRLTEVFNGRLSALETQIGNQEKFVAAMRGASETAIAAAFAAADKAITAQNLATAVSIQKSEANFIERIKGLETLVNSNKETLSTQIGEQRSRLDRGDGLTRGGQEMRTERRLDTGAIIGVVLGITGVVSLVVTLITFALRAHS